MIAILEGLKAITSLIPGWLYAILLALCLGYCGVVTVERNLARGELTKLQAAVDKQKATAAAELAADIATTLARQKVLDAASLTQNELDKANVKTAQTFLPGLTGALASRSYRLCQPSGLRGGGASGQIPATAGAGAKH